MAQFDVSMSVDVEVEFDKGEWEEFFQTHKRLQPACMIASAGHAESLEYGTGPLCEFQPTVEGGAYTWESIYHALDRWARIKLKKKKTHSQFAYDLTNKFWLKGMKPHPYWRPALAWVEANLQAEFDKGYSIYEILDEALRIAYRHIHDNNWEFEGWLEQSLSVHELPSDETGITDIDDIINDVWDEGRDRNKS